MNFINLSYQQKISPQNKNCHFSNFCFARIIIKNGKNIPILIDELSLTLTLIGDLLNHPHAVNILISLNV